MFFNKILNRYNHLQRENQQLNHIFIVRMSHFGFFHERKYARCTDVHKTDSSELVQLCASLVYFEQRRFNKEQKTIDLPFLQATEGGAESKQAIEPMVSELDK